MDENELRNLEEKYEKKTGKDATVSVPASIFIGDVADYVERARPLKVALASGKENRDESQRIQGMIDMLKRTARARVIQRELNKMDGRPEGFITPWPDVPKIV